MNRRPSERLSEDMASHEPAKQAVHNHSQIKQPFYLQIAWILLLLLGALFFLAALLDLAADARVGLPSDHTETFRSIAGSTWTTAQQSAPKITQYVTLLEITYAVHEMVFALLFIAIVAIPFRRRARWAWWTCWVPLLANLTYTFTFAHYSSTTLVYSLIADVALPVLLLLHAPAFFGRSKQHAASP